MMKFLLIVSMIRFIVAFIDMKTKTKKQNNKDAVHNSDQHPAEFRVR